MSQFIEVTVLYHSNEVDPREPYDRSEMRLFNLDEIEAVFRHGDGSVLQFKRPNGRPVPVGEPYEYFAAALTSWQPRVVTHTNGGASRP